MAFLRLKWFILLGLLTIMFLFLLNTFILYSDQEEYLNTESKEIGDGNKQREYEDVFKETETRETGDDNTRPEMKGGGDSEAEATKNDKLSLPDRQSKQTKIQSILPDESCERKHVPKNISNAAKEGKSESPVKPPNNKDKSTDREHVTQVSKDQDTSTSNGGKGQVVTTKMSRRSEQEKRKEKEKEKREKDGYGKHAFNQTASDKISLDRSIPDTRDPSCQHNKYLHNLPTTSVIICFHNEALSTLLRTVHSVLNRSPDNLLAEILLVDDFSEYDDLMKGLDDAVLQLNKVRVLRIASREGLIRARLLGAKAAKGDVITFLDSHCEVNADWLEPLLTRIKDDRTTVTVPVIDNIDFNTFEYKAQSGKTIGGFSWYNMAFFWHHVNLTEGPAEPRRTPVMPGGLFSMERKFFFEVGSYDEGMDIWGGENLEMSFRLWQCGGKMEIVPCSRVGHVYRRRIPYKFPEGTGIVIRNIARVVHVWMDEYKKYAYIRRPELKSYPYGDISSRLQLRSSLKCKSFGWYLENVYPEQPLPARDFEVFGEVRNPHSGMCLETVDRATAGSPFGVAPCHGQIYNQWFFLSKKGGLTLGEYETTCVDTSDGHVGLVKCKRGIGYPGPWSLQGKTLYHSRDKECLEVSPNDQRLVTSQCNDSPAQEWIIS